MQKTYKNILHTTLRITKVVIFTCLINLQATAGGQNPYGGSEIKNEPPTPAAVPVPVTAEMGTDGVQRLPVILDSYIFSPAYIIVLAGKPVEFTLKNVASVAPHSFKIDATADGLDIYREVAAGQSATLTFTPAKPGVYEFYCDKKLGFLPSHRKKGMVGKLEVR